MASGEAAAGTPAPEHTWVTYSIVSRGARAQFVLAVGLISLLPLLAVGGVVALASLGYDPGLRAYGAIAATTLVLVGLGYVLLIKYPLNVIRLRRYL